MDRWLLALALFVGVVYATETQVLHLDLVNRSGGYHGLVSEDQLIVDVTPKIRAVGTDVCAFRIVNKHHGETPFEIVLKDREKGEAELRAKKPLNCEKKKNYKFDIVAVSCTGIYSDNATVRVSVNDVNEYVPKFTEASYVVDVDEGRPEDKILQVEATDGDCSAKYGDICRYEILNKDQPFAIDSEGVIRNTEPLDYEKNHNHILQVVAFDCGMKRSDPVLVTVKVNRVCRLGWTGIVDRVEYTPGSGRQDLFPDAQINLCDVPCQPESIQTKITLTTSHLGKSCDRDTYTVQNQRKLCRANGKAIDLLPPPGPGAEWTKDLPTDQGREADQVYVFDGSTGAVVPLEVMPHNLTRNFTISLWLKHEHHAGQDKHVKEHIICNADDHQMNRHHFSLFVRNCRLILLLRREYGDGDLKSFRPAEWRWKLPEVCDGDWHHYAVSMGFPNAQLYVDGRLFTNSKNNPDIIDDWPLHNSHGLNTTMTVGACWQGSQSTMQHFMRGSMAGLSVLVGQNEQPEVFSCFHKCKESLEAPPMELLQPGMEILNNNDLTELTLEGENKTNLEVLVRKVAYANLRDFPTPGRRPLRIHTNIVCSSGRTLKIPMIESAIVVQSTPLPIVTVNGLSTSHYGYDALRNGVRLFPDARIEVTNADDAVDSSSEEDESDEDDDVVNIPQRVDSCTATVYPPLNPDHETLTWPHNLVDQFKLEVRFSHDGITLMGSDSARHYEQILHQIQYNNHKPAYYLTRAFKLVCSEMNGRFVSSELVHTVTVDHPQAASLDLSTSTADGITSTAGKPSTVVTTTTTTDKSPESVDSKKIPASSLQLQQVVLHQYKSPAPAHAKVEHHHVDIRPAQTLSDVYMANSMGNAAQVTANLSSGASHTVTIIVLVCAGFLILMISLGVVRVRAARRRAQQDEAAADTEMAWDDSALTITVNPMETLEGVEKSTMTRSPLQEDSDSDDGNSSCHGNDSSDEDPDDDDEEGGACGKSRDLEWDNSTLSI